VYFLSLPANIHALRIKILDAVNRIHTRQIAPHWNELHYRWGTSGSYILGANFIYLVVYLYIWGFIYDLSVNEYIL
jgi:hypothetical protein